MEQLVKQHAHLIPRLARRMKKRLPTADVDELTSVGYLALVRAARNYRGDNGCKFSTHLYTWAMRSMQRAHMRPDGRKGTCEQRFVPLEAARNVAVSTISPFDHAAKSERDERLARAWRLLRPRHQQVLWLHYFEELTLVQIGEMWGWHRHRVMKTMRYARAALGQALTGNRPYLRNEYAPRRRSHAVT